MDNKTTSTLDQPEPLKNDLAPVWDTVVEVVRTRYKQSYQRGLVDRLVEDMLERDRVGRARYGTPLQPFNGRDALTDAYQELLDAVVYLTQDAEETRLRGEPKDEDLLDMRDSALHAAKVLKSRILDRERTKLVNIL